MTSASKAGGGSRGFLIAIVAICILGAGLIAVVIGSGAGNDPDAVDATSAVTIEGDALPAMPNVGGLTSSDNDSAIGMTAPRLVGTDFADNEIVIEADGRPKAVYFVAHWCPHCQVEVPVVQELIDAGSLPEGMDVYGVSTSVSAGRGNYPPNRWLDSTEGWGVTTMRDTESSEALQSYGAGGFPYVVYLDGDNKVLARSSGELGSAAIAAAWQITAGSAIG
ncbi:MAG: thioredoxin fold domain-containing protein [Acidimicrobiales bacterium]